MKFFYKKNPKLFASLILALNLLLFIFAFQKFVITRNNELVSAEEVQETLICPTLPQGGNSIQLLQCYINTPTPTMPVTPTLTPTITPIPPSPTPDPCAAPQKDYASAKQVLLSKYKIDLQGDQNLEFANQTVTTVCKLATSTLFMSLLTSQGNIVLTYQELPCANFGGYADMNAGITIRAVCDPPVNRAVLVHEFTHMIMYRNAAVYNKFLNTVWPTSIPTFNCQTNAPGLAPSECFADGSAEYVTYTYYRIAVNGQPLGPPNLPDYTTTYAGYYNFMKDNLYGGVTYTSF